MESLHLGVVEAHFAELVWENEPLHTKDLVALCQKELQWKRTTTYTVLKKLCNRGIFITEDSIVRSLISKSKFYAMRSESFVEEHFEGSLPAFLAAFTSRKALTPEDLAEIKKLMDAYEKES